MEAGKKAAPDITPVTAEEELKYDGQIMVMVSITVPKLELTENKAAKKRINKYYEFLAVQKRKYAAATLFRQAVKDYKSSLQSSFAFRPAELTVTYDVSFNDGKLLSVIIDVYEYTGGAHGLTVRYSDTWSLITGYPAGRLFPPKKRPELLAQILKQATIRQQSGEADYFEGLSANIKKYFRAEQTYLTPEGMAVFYQLYTIAPYAAGIQTFKLS